MSRGWIWDIGVGVTGIWKFTDGRRRRGQGLNHVVVGMCGVWVGGRVQVSLAVVVLVVDVGPWVDGRQIGRMGQLLVRVGRSGR